MRVAKEQFKKDEEERKAKGIYTAEELKQIKLEKEKEEKKLIKRRYYYLLFIVTIQRIQYFFKRIFPRLHIILLEKVLDLFYYSKITVANYEYMQLCKLA